MKKRVLFLLVGLFFLCGSSVWAEGAVETQGYILGDIDGSGTIDAIDALQGLRYAVHEIMLSGNTYKAADVTGNRLVNSVDSLAILQYSVGLRKDFNGLSTKTKVVSKGDNGVDFSEWQADQTEWDRVKKAGYNFVFLRCSYGWDEIAPNGNPFGEKDVSFELFMKVPKKPE